MKLYPKLVMKTERGILKYYNDYTLDFQKSLENNSHFEFNVK